MKLEKENSPVSKKLMELDDGFFFFLAEVSSLDIWAQVVRPSKPAAFSTSH